MELTLPNYAHLGRVVRPHPQTQTLLRPDHPTTHPGTDFHSESRDVYPPCPAGHLAGAGPCYRQLKQAQRALITSRVMPSAPILNDTKQQDA